MFLAVDCAPTDTLIEALGVDSHMECRGARSCFETSIKNRVANEGHCCQLLCCCCLHQKRHLRFVRQRVADGEGFPHSKGHFSTPTLQTMKKCLQQSCGRKVAGNQMAHE